MPEISIKEILKLRDLEKNPNFAILYLGFG